MFFMLVSSVCALVERFVIVSRRLGVFLGAQLDGLVRSRAPLVREARSCNP
jgi:hypothetical protein